VIAAMLAHPNQHCIDAPLVLGGGYESLKFGV